MSIQDYIDSVLSSTNYRTADVDWRRRFTEQGYYTVLPGQHGLRLWNEMHEWCEKHIGVKHYSWTGSRFWFETEDAAFRFTLRWS